MRSRVSATKLPSSTPSTIMYPAVRTAFTVCNSQSDCVRQFTRRSAMSVVRLEDFADHGIGTLLHLGEHLREVHAEDSETEERQPAEEPHGHDQRRPTLQQLAEEHPANDEICAEHAGQHRDADAKIEDEHQWRAAERRHRIHEVRDLLAD